MPKIFTKQLTFDALRLEQRKYHREAVFLSGVVPASDVITTRVNLSTYGAAFSLSMTGTFSTLDLVNQHIIDDGICHLRGQLSDSADNKNLYQDFIPLSLILSPGRRKDKLAENYLVAVGGVADAATPGGTLYEAAEFEYLYDVKSDIVFTVKNDASYPNSFEIMVNILRLAKSSGK